MRRSWRTFAPLTVLAALVAAVLPSAGAQAAPASNYVALGDSFASGPGIPTQIDSTCLRSDHNYAHLLAAALKPTTFTDVTCGGATIPDLTGSQATGVAPQLNAVTSNTTLVTLTIGGNDIGFGSIVLQCSLLSGSNFLGNPCQQHYTSGGTDQIDTAINALAPKLDTAIQQIKAKAPHARIIVVSYLRLLPDLLGCWPAMPIAVGDVPWATAKEKNLDAMLATRASADGAISVNPYAMSTGHDACQATSTRWTEPLLGAITAPAHPNAAGMAAVAGQIENALAG
jgi:lysophospholipase L1-like esterase